MIDINRTSSRGLRRVSARRYNDVSNHKRTRNASFRTSRDRACGISFHFPKVIVCKKYMLLFLTTSNKFLRSTTAVYKSDEFRRHGVIHLL